MTRTGISTFTLVSLLACGCADEGGDEAAELGDADTSGDGDTDVDGDGDGDADGTTGDGDSSGDGDGDSTTTGDGDGDSTTTGDGDGDGDTTDTSAEACAGAVAPAGSLAVGQPVSHWGGGFTVEGDEWDYCELDGTPFLLILSAGWCGPCQDLAGGLAGMPSQWGAQLDPIRAGLEAGTLGVVEVLVDNFVDFDATSLQDLQNWEGMFPNEYVHLIGDPTPGVNGDEPLWQYLGPSHNGALPGGILVDADFNLQVLTLPEAIAAAAQYAG